MTMPTYAGKLTDIPDPRDDRVGADYPAGQGQDITLSRDAANATYETYPSLPGIVPPSGDAATQTLNAPTPPTEGS